MIDQTTIDKILTTADIVEVVGEFVSLAKRGTQYVGLCPFHEDKNPSLVVSPSRGTFKCFACGEGGNVVKFLMKHRKMNYGEALHWLAKKYNIEIMKQDDKSPEQKRQDRDFMAMRDTNLAVMSYYSNELTKLENHGMEYLKSRGITDAMIEKFHLGYCPLESEVIGVVKKAGIDIKYLFQQGADVTFRSGKSLHIDNGIGILYQTDDTHRFVDRYHGRVIFPWFDRYGRVVGFGGRKIDFDKEQSWSKYINSPESIIMHKGDHLYGLYQAIPAIAQYNNVYIVEGYLDVISLHQIGIENVVSCSGTTLSEAQIQLFASLTHNATVMLDSDAAGQQATLKSIDKLLAGGINVYVVKLPEGEDPDSFAHHEPAEVVADYLQTHKQDFLDFECQNYLHLDADPVQTAEEVKAILRSISWVQDNIRRELYFMRFQRICGIKEEILRQEMYSYLPQGKPDSNDSHTRDELPKEESVEDEKLPLLA